MAQMVKHLSTMWETWVRSLGWEDSLEKEMATHSSTLALRIPWTEELGAGYYPWGRKQLGTTERLHFLSFLGSWTHWRNQFMWNVYLLSDVKMQRFLLSVVVTSIYPLAAMAAPAAGLGWAWFGEIALTLASGKLEFDLLPLLDS